MAAGSVKNHLAMREVGRSVGACVISAGLAHGAEQQLGQSEDAVPRAALAPDGREQLRGRAGAGAHGRRDHLLGGDHSSAGMSHLGG